MENRKYKWALFFLVILLIVLNYNSLDSFVIKNVMNYEIVEVERVIDGDTLVVNKSSMRLLGIYNKSV